MRAMTYTHADICVHTYINYIYAHAYNKYASAHTFKFVHTTNLTVFAMAQPRHQLHINTHYRGAVFTHSWTDIRLILMCAGLVCGYLLSQMQTGDWAPKNPPYVVQLLLCACVCVGK